MLGENYKDVIVSQPPAMYNKPNNVSLENFKGILLCEKPAALGFVAPGDGKAFVPPNPTGNPVGYGPTDEQLQRRQRDEQTRAANYKRNVQRHHQYLSRHRKWLHSFAKQMKAMKESEAAEEVERAQRAVRIREMETAKRVEQLLEQQRKSKEDEVEQLKLLQEKQQQQERQLARQQEVACAACAGLPLPPISTVRAAPQQTPHTPQVRRPSAPGSGNKMRKGGGGAKPKWAMTEEEAFLADEDEEERLLEFAKGLDYGKFIADYTVAEALQVMRDRVQEIAKANNWSKEDVMRAAEEDRDDDEDDEEDQELDGEARGSRPKKGLLGRPSTPHASASLRESHLAADGGYAAHDHDWDSSSFRGRILRRAISKDALTLADRILQNSPSMQKVYTRQSLARVLQKCAMDGEPVNDAFKRNVELGKMSSGELATATAIGPQIEVAPVKVTIGANSTALEQPAGRILVELQRSKEKTQNLPYLYRCPAI